MQNREDSRKGMTAILDKPLPHKRADLLIVEDDRQLRKLLSNLLTNQGYNVTVCESANDAVKVIAGNTFHLIVSDVMMPGMSGMELLEKAKEVAPATEFIIMTGSPRVNAAVEAMKIGAFDYVSKPFNLQEIKEKIEKAASRSMDKVRPDKTAVFEKYSRKLAGFGIIRTLGEGSMGVVFHAERMVNNKPKYFALKIIKHECQDKEIVDRFFKEAKAASEINHPNIIHVSEHGYAREENIPYLVMEYFKGITLKEIINCKVKYSLEEKVNILLQIARAVEAAHKHGIIHRDIKPENIMIDKNQVAKLTDFGIVQLPNSEQTSMHKMIGTPYYLAPESFSCPKVTSQADIYSLGTVAYEFLLGVRPFYSECITALGFKVQTENPQEPIRKDKNFPVNLQVILEKMLMKNINSRYESASELVQDLERLKIEGFRKKKALQRISWNTLK